MEQSPLLFEFQRLEFYWEELEKKEYSEMTRQLIEKVWERQVEILNQITFQ